MPYLPSGRAVAVSLQPFDELLDRALAEQDVSLLASVEELDEIFCFAQVLEVEERSDVPRVELEPVCAPHRLMHCMTQDTGYTVYDIIRLGCDWPDEDVSAFREFMLTDRVRDWVVSRQVRLFVLRNNLTDYSTNPERR